MKKNIIRLIIFGLLTNGCIASPKKYVDQKSKSTKITILQNGVKRDIYLSNSGTKKLSTGIKKEGVIIKFIDDKKTDIKSLEETYGLKLKEKLVIGYYIFDNVSQKSDSDLVSSIISNETNIKTIKPNWKMQNQTR